ncbi:hypothetical protein TWF730_002369 [Orbilia blumenaviensis]|uniref:Uncharacterized protein n=1 Tax=Orbilia blumenaviensis TaxID=1796055 RepID=A0AAV9UE83_9PEZI
MPRVTRSQAAALQNADGREPFEEVTDNVKLPEPPRKSTRARSKAGTRKENYSAEGQPAPAVNGAVETSSHCAGTAVLNRSTRVTRSQATKAPEVIVVDEIETIEVTTTRRTRSTRRTRQTAAGIDTEHQQEELVAVAPPNLITRGRRAERDSLAGPLKPSPSKIPSPIRPPHSPAAKADETPSKPAAAGLFAKGPSPAPPSRSVSRSTKKAAGGDPLAGKPPVKPLAERIAAAVQPKETLPPLAISTPLVDRVGATIPEAFGLPTPLHFAASTPNSKFAPRTPATKKPVVLGSPFTSSPTRKIDTKMPPATASLKSFATPTKAQLARRSTIFPSKSSTQDGGSRNTSMTVNISQTVPKKEQQPALMNSDQSTPTRKAVPAVLFKKAPIIATTKAALLRTQKATGKPMESTVRVVPSQNSNGVEAPANLPIPSQSVVQVQPKTVAQKTDARRPIAATQTRPVIVSPSKGISIRSIVKTQEKPSIEATAKTMSRPLPRVATTSSQPKQESVNNATKPQQPVTSIGSATASKPAISSLIRKPSIPTLPKTQPGTLSKKPSIPTLSKATTALSKKASVPELPRVTTAALARKPSIPALPKAQAPILSKKPSIPTLPATAVLPKKPSMSTLPKNTADLSRKPSIPTLPRATSNLSKKPSIPALLKATAAMPSNAPAPTPTVENPVVGDIMPKKDEPAKTTKLVTQKKPFQPVKSTKPLTVPIPFQYDPGNRAARPTGQPKAPFSQATLPKTSTASAVKDRVKKFEAPKQKPVVIKDARTILREMRKEARLGTLPKLTGEVVYAELPQVEDLKINTLVTPQDSPLEVDISEPVVASVPVIPSGSIESPPVLATNMTPTQQISPTEPLTHEIVVVAGREDVSPQRTVPYEDFEKLKMAKDRAEAYARGTNAVLNWATQEMVKRNAEAASRR